MVSSRLTLVAVLLVALVGCSPTASGPASSAGASSGMPAPLTVFGAASLKSALGKAALAFEASHPQARVVLATDSSAALETQIEQGAPADVFLSADESNPKKLIDQGLVEGEVVPFARNVLTIIVPAGNPARISTARDLAGPRVKIIAAGDAVPITKYANQLVDILSARVDTGGVFAAPDGFAMAYAENIVSREDNVKAVVAKIELGEGDAAIVYATDARASSKVRTIPLPDGVNVPATYGAVVLRTPNAGLGRTFLQWLTGRDGLAILAEAGFLAPSS